jgi:hypothetical protein
MSLKVNETEERPVATQLSRRRFIAGSGAVVAASSLSGCIDTDGNDFGVPPEVRWRWLPAVTRGWATKPCGCWHFVVRQ